MALTNAQRQQLYRDRKAECKDSIIVELACGCCEKCKEVGKRIIFRGRTKTLRYKGAKNAIKSI